MSTSIHTPDRHAAEYSLADFMLLLSTDGLEFKPIMCVNTIPFRIRQRLVTDYFATLIDLSHEPKRIPVIKYHVSPMPQTPGDVTRWETVPTGHTPTVMCWGRERERSLQLEQA